MSEEENFRTITAQFASVCIVCGERVEIGTKIEWSKELGVRHQTCQKNEISPENPIYIERDLSAYKNPTLYSLTEARKIINCQKCDKELDSHERRLDAIKDGYVSVCEKCF